MSVMIKNSDAAIEQPAMAMPQVKLPASSPRIECREPTNSTELDVASTVDAEIKAPYESGMVFSAARDGKSQG